MNPLTRALVQEIYIDAKPDRVFDALTDPAELAQWWGSSERYVTADWQLELRPGGAWSCSGLSASGTRYALAGTVREVRRPSRLAYSWRPSWGAAAETEVVFDLVPHGSGTLVRVTHSGFAPQSRDVQEHEAGWYEVLGWLRESFEAAR